MASRTLCNLERLTPLSSSVGAAMPLRRIHTWVGASLIRYGVLIALLLLCPAAAAARLIAPQSKQPTYFGI